MKQPLPMPTYSNGSEWTTTAQNQKYREARQWLQRFAADDVEPHLKRLTARRAWEKHRAAVSAARRAAFNAMARVQRNNTAENVTALIRAQHKAAALIQLSPSLQRRHKAAFRAALSRMAGEHEAHHCTRDVERQHTAARYRAYVAAVDSAAAMFQSDAGYRPAAEKVRLARDIVNRAYLIYSRSATPRRVTHRHDKTQIVDNVATYARERFNTQYTATTTTAADVPISSRNIDVLLIRHDDSERVATALNAARLTTQHQSKKARVEAAIGAILNSTTSADFKPAWTAQRMAGVLKRYGFSAGDRHDNGDVVRDVLKARCVKGSWRGSDVFYSR